MLVAFRAYYEVESVTQNARSLTTQVVKHKLKQLLCAARLLIQGRDLHAERVAFKAKNLSKRWFRVSPNDPLIQKQRRHSRAIGRAFLVRKATSSGSCCLTSAPAS